MLAEHRSSNSGDGKGLATARRARVPSFEWSSVRASFVPFAFEETVSIKDPLDQQVRINFTRHHGQATEPVSDVSVVVKLPNGKDLAAYRLSGVLSPEVRNHVQNILSFAEERNISPLLAARALWNATASAARVAWVPERILDRSTGEDVIPPMAYAIPSFNEYLTNPSCVTSRFFCARHEGSNHTRLESHISVEAGRAVLDLSITDQHDKVQKRLFELVTTKDRALDSDEEIRRDLLVQTYKAMEILWQHGSEELQRHLLIRESNLGDARQDLTRELSVSEGEALVDTMIANGSIELPAWDASYELSSGAMIQFGAGKHLALVSLRGAGESPSVYSWVFRDETGDLSDQTNPLRREILSAMRQFATFDSDEVRLDAIQRLRSFKFAIPMPVAAPLESIVGSELAYSLSVNPAVEVSSVVPGDSEDIVRMSHGIESIRLSLSDRRLKRTAPQLLDQIDVDFKQDGSLEIIGVNRLGGRLTGVISRHALHEAGEKETFLQELADTMAAQPTQGLREIQRLIQDTVARDENASWMSTSGDPYSCGIPPLEDIEGHRMYSVGTLLIKKYSEISCGSPDDCRLHYISHGRVGVTLGLSSEPYQLSVIIDGGRVRRLEVTPNLKVNDTTYRPDYEKSRRYECDLSIMASQEDRSTLIRSFHLFDALLSSLSFSATGAIGVDFDRSDLRSFLDRMFGPPRRHLN